MQTKKVQIETIKLDPSNPRSITKEAFESLKQSITDFPEMQSVKPLVVADGYAIAGNMRLLAYKDLGYRELHVIDVTAWSQAKRDEFMIKDNTHFGSWNYDMLANEWDTLPLTEWGLDVWEPEVEEIKGLTDEDDVPEAPEEPITKLGDVWLLGEHRVMCGDSTSKEAVEILMDGEKANVLITDPPYGINLDTNYSKMGKTTTKYEKIKGDELEFDLREVVRLSGTTEQYIWGGDYFINSIDWLKGTPIVWAKRHSEEENKVFGSAFEILWTNYKCKKAIWFIRPINQSSERLGKHPTQKPIECMTRCINMTKLTGPIYDAFLGSGSTLIAAEKTNRKCYGMELDPKYCDVIVKRWEDFTGKKAHLEENEFEVITQAN